jgi:hypothetical protein
MAGELDILSSLMSMINAGRGSASGQTITSTGGETIQSGGGGTVTSSQYTSPGDTAALRALLGELGGADYQGVLESIFAQAGGKIPGFMGALQNSVGARSGGNSAVAAMLQKLMSETVLQGQSQIADLGLRNANIRAQLGANIAQATRGTHQSGRQVTSANPTRVTRTPQVQTTTPQKEPYGIGEMAALLGAGSLFKNTWDSFRKDKQDGSNVPVRDSIGTPVTSAMNSAGMDGGGGIITDSWLNQGPQQSGSIFSFNEPNFLSDTGLNFDNGGASFNDFLSNDAPQFDLGNIDYGQLFDGGGFDFGGGSQEYYDFAENNDFLGF